MSKAEVDAYLASPEAERDQQVAERANREHSEQLVEDAFRVRADELGAMTPPATGTPTRSRERRDPAGRSSSGRSGSDSSDPDLPEPAEPPLGVPTRAARRRHPNRARRDRELRATRRLRRGTA